MANRAARNPHKLQFALAALTALLTIVGSEQLTDLFFFRKGYQCQSSSPSYTQATAHSTRIECSSMCQRLNCAGMNFDMNSRVCTIFPSIDRVVIGPANMLMRAGEIEKMARDNGYLSIGGRRFVKIVQSPLSNESLALGLCTTVFAFGSLFVPRSLFEMKSLGIFSKQNGTDNNDYFIGLGDSEVEGQLKWTDGTGYNGLISPIMFWKGGNELQDNTVVRDTVTSKLKPDDRWETKFKDGADGSICQIDLT